MFDFFRIFFFWKFDLFFAIICTNTVKMFPSHLGISD